MQDPDLYVECRGKSKCASWCGTQSNEQQQRKSEQAGARRIGIGRDFHIVQLLSREFPQNGSFLTLGRESRK
jgi:hypothetical protein